MRRYFVKSTVLSNLRIAKNTYRMELDFGVDLSHALPGQFINLYFDSIFPRPFSIAGIDHNIVTILYKVVGYNTIFMSEMKKGDMVKVLGPLGKGFKIENSSGKLILIGGGIGIAPLVFLSDYLNEKNIDYIFFAGFKNRDEVINLDKQGKIYISTDDGSYGFKGTVVDLFLSKESEINHGKNMFCCGPEPLLKSLINISNKKNYNIQVALEKVMGCGTGLCQGCAVEYYKEGKKEYKLVCKDGPVFDGRHVRL
ncbi:MAG: dihydroorotate dehydrogenase electron transfer subunit [Candidatus Marinimicrobia bacterium]|nr:dihydroorotate dehydrogenase electron transfer subunit [Candidatus Neomarinimicrobiota bacterium]